MRDLRYVCCYCGQGYLEYPVSFVFLSSEHNSWDIIGGLCAKCAARWADEGPRREHLIAFERLKRDPDIYRVSQDIRDIYIAGQSYGVAHA